jgi:hypothetical protein
MRYDLGRFTLFIFYRTVDEYGILYCQVGIQWPWDDGHVFFGFETYR